MIIILQLGKTQRYMERVYCWKGLKMKEITVKYHLSTSHCILVYPIVHIYIINIYNWTSQKLMGHQNEWFKWQMNSEFSFCTLDHCSPTNQAQIEWLCLFFHGLLPPSWTQWHPICSPDGPLTGVKSYVIILLHTYYYLDTFYASGSPKCPRYSNCSTSHLSAQLRQCFL